MKHKLLTFDQKINLKPLYRIQLYCFVIMIVMPKTSDTNYDMKQTINMYTGIIVNKYVRHVYDEIIVTSAHTPPYKLASKV